MKNWSRPFHALEKLHLPPLFPTNTMGGVFSVTKNFFAVDRLCFLLRGALPIGKLSIS
jgi:hypothetical protein